MRIPEPDIRESCPQCGLKVVRCGSFVESFGRSYADEATYIGDVIDSSIACSRCGAELVHSVERLWEDHCFVCGCGYQHWYVFEAEWQKDRKIYRWSCACCNFNILATFVANWSPLLAKLLWIPLLLLSAVFWVGLIVWFLLQETRRLVLN